MCGNDTTIPGWQWVPGVQDSAFLRRGETTDAGHPDRCSGLVLPLGQAGRGEVTLTHSLSSPPLPRAACSMRRLLASTAAHSAPPHNGL